jgi:hypothetical protein
VGANARLLSGTESLMTKLTKFSVVYLIVLIVLIIVVYFRTLYLAQQWVAG